MEIISTVQECRDLLNSAKGSIGLVPTMGAIHEGHIALLKTAKSQCDTVVASIFVNPLQFNIREDYLSYPKNVSNDLKIMKEQKADIVFMPLDEEMYPPSFTTKVIVKNLSQRLEGVSRPGHLDGVATIVIKLLNICAPDFVYFGQKDAQQLLMIKRMISDLNIRTELIYVDTVRSSDGLALSSRNSNLNKLEKQSALGLFSALNTAYRMRVNGEYSAEKIKTAMKKDLTRHGAELDYISICDPDSFNELDIVDKNAIALVAAHIGKTRLIDNMFI